MNLSLLKTLAGAGIVLWVGGGLSQLGREALGPSPWFRAKSDTVQAVGRPTERLPLVEVVLTMIQQQGGFDRGFLVVYPRTDSIAPGHVRLFHQAMLQGYPHHPNVGQAPSGMNYPSGLPGVIVMPGAPAPDSGYRVADQNQGVRLFLPVDK